MMEAEVAGLAMMREIAERGLELAKHRDPESQTRIREFLDLYRFMEREMPLLLEKWRQTQGDQS